MEHDAICPIVNKFAKDKLALRFRFAPQREYWFMTTTDDCDNTQDQYWSGVSLLHYAVHTATNAIRFSEAIPEAEVHRALWQAALEGSKGSRLMSSISAAARRLTHITTDE